MKSVFSNTAIYIKCKSKKIEIICAMCKNKVKYKKFYASILCSNSVWNIIWIYRKRMYIWEVSEGIFKGPPREFICFWATLLWCCLENKKKKTKWDFLSTIAYLNQNF